MAHITTPASLDSAVRHDQVYLQAAAGHEDHGSLDAEPLQGNVFREGDLVRHIDAEFQLQPLPEPFVDPFIAHRPPLKGITALKSVR